LLRKQRTNFKNCWGYFILPHPVYYRLAEPCPQKVGIPQWR